MKGLFRVVLLLRIYVLVYAMTHNGRFIAHGDICITLAIKSDKLALLDFRAVVVEMSVESRCFMVVLSALSGDLTLHGS